MADVDHSSMLRPSAADVNDAKSKVFRSGSPQAMRQIAGSRDVTLSITRSMAFRTLTTVRQGGVPQDRLEALESTSISLGRAL
ncbi:MAG: hypothetical protein AAF334_01160 [Pseudomonadota bacterium]